MALGECLETLIPRRFKDNRTACMIFEHSSEFQAPVSTAKFVYRLSGQFPKLSSVTGPLPPSKAVDQSLTP